MDRRVNPCDDFYQFACGNFSESYPMDIVTTIKVLGQLKAIFEEEIKPDDIKPFRLVKSLYKSCIDKCSELLCVFVFCSMR